MYWLFLYRNDTKQIELAKSNSYQMPVLAGFDCPSTFTQVEIKNPEYVISRDHKVILSNGQVITTEYSLNPNQPQPSPAELQQEADIARAIELLATSPPVITMPEMWELMRIYARLLNIH